MRRIYDRQLKSGCWLTRCSSMVGCLVINSCSLKNLSAQVERVMHFPKPWLMPKLDRLQREKHPPA